MSTIHIYAIRALQGILVVAALLSLQAWTSNGDAGLEPFVELGREAALESTETEDRPPVDQLRSICSVEWPATIAGADTAKARTRACRAFGQ